MNNHERKASNHFSFSMKLGKPEDYENLNAYQKRREFFVKRNKISNDSEVLKLLENGYDDFVLRTAERIEKENPNQYVINRCPACNFIARTPYAKQCRKCSNNWHNEIEGEFKFDDCLKLSRIPYLFIVGELVKGNVFENSRIDLTNFQLNIIAKVKKIEFCLKWVDGVKKDLPSLGIEVNSEDEKLIRKHLTKSAKTIMILKDEIGQSESLTLKDARKLVEIEIGKLLYKEEVVIYDDYTIEFDYGWAFFYNLKNLNKGGLTGGGPFLVNKFTSEIVPTGSGDVPEFSIDRYEEKIRGKKNVWTIRLKNKIGFSKYVKHYKLNKRTLRFSKDIWNILNSHPGIITSGSIENILKLKRELEDVGIEIIVEKNGKINTRLSIFKEGF